jgi:hypothetical protein
MRKKERGKRRKSFPPVLPTLDYANPRYGLAAVIAAHAENENGQVFDGFAPDSDAWLNHSDMRADLFRRTRMAWCRITGRDFTRFPFSEDFVVRLYGRVMLASAARRKAWRLEVTPRKKGER